VAAAWDHGPVPQPLDEALASLRPLLLDAALVRAVAAGRRRGTAAPGRAELRPVDLGRDRIRHLQVITTAEGGGPITRNLPPGEDAAAAVDALLAEPFGSWYVEAAGRVVQLRVTKRGDAQVHETRQDRERDPDPAPHDRVKQRLIDPGDPLFAALGADAAKRRQVDAFLRQLAPLARDATARAAAEGRPLHVVDLGCGNAYLTFAAHRYLSGLPDLPAGGVRTVGIDVRAELASRNTELAGSLDLAGLEFITGEIAHTEPGSSPVDVVLALHACDTATDDALARAVRWRARAILAAPCCHHDVQQQIDAGRRSGEIPPHPYAALTRHPILKERFADVLTDALRADLLRLLGYRVDVVEFVASRHTPRNALVRAAFTDAPASARRIAEYTDLVAAWRLRPALARLLGPEVAAITDASAAHHRLGAT
jgi:hypothetical protein